jgi:hypothetical protein
MAKAGDAAAAGQQPSGWSSTPAKSAGARTPGSGGDLGFRSTPSISPSGIATDTTSAGRPTGGTGAGATDSFPGYGTGGSSGFESRGTTGGAGMQDSGMRSTGYRTPASMSGEETRYHDANPVGMSPAAVPQQVSAPPPPPPPPARLPTGAGSYQTSTPAPMPPSPPAAASVPAYPDAGAGAGAVPQPMPTIPPYPGPSGDN